MNRLVRLPSNKQQPSKGGVAVLDRSMSFWPIVVVALLVLGCRESFPPGGIVQKIDLTALLVPSEQSQVALLPLSSIEATPDCQICDSQVIVSMTDDKQDAWLDGVMSRAAKEIARHGGKVTGNGHGGNTTRTFRRVNYETRQTTGEIRLYAFALEKSKVGAAIVQLEYPKRALH
jgi:hypothetical protein